MDGKSTTDEIWEHTERYAGFEIPDNCPCCAKKCAFEEHWKNCFKVAVRDTMIYKRVGPGKRYKSQSQLRRHLYKAVHSQINQEWTQRKELPNCITSAIRGLLHGDGTFTGFKEKENKPH